MLQIIYMQTYIIGLCLYAADSAPDGALQQIAL